MFLFIEQQFLEFFYCGHWFFCLIWKKMRVEKEIGVVESRAGWVLEAGYQLEC